MQNAPGRGAYSMRDVRTLISVSDAWRKPGAEFDGLESALDSALSENEMSLEDVFENEEVLDEILDHLYTQYNSPLSDPRREGQAMVLGEKCSKLRRHLRNQRNRPENIERAWEMAMEMYIARTGKIGSDEMVVFHADGAETRGCVGVLHPRHTGTSALGGRRGVHRTPRWFHELLTAENLTLGGGDDAVSECFALEAGDHSRVALVSSEIFSDMSLDEVFGVADALR